MPLGANLHEPDFLLRADDNLFFELTTQTGSLIHVPRSPHPLSYIQKKVAFHAKIQRSETDFKYPDGQSTATGRSVLILVFNGADSTGVYPHLYGCLASHGDLLVGSSVFASFSLITQWDPSLTLREEEAEVVMADAASIYAE